VAAGGRRSYDWRPWAGGPEAASRLDPGSQGPVDAGTPNRRVRQIRSSALNGLFILACVYTLALARAFLVPLAIGLMLYFLLRPPVRTLKSIRVPEPLGAALVLAALLAVVGSWSLYAPPGRPRPGPRGPPRACSASSPGCGRWYVASSD
jgi:hypothetical protein